MLGFVRLLTPHTWRVVHAAVTLTRICPLLTKAQEWIVAVPEGPTWMDPPHESTRPPEKMMLRAINTAP